MRLSFAGGNVLLCDLLLTNVNTKRKQSSLNKCNLFSILIEKSILIENNINRIYVFVSFALSCKVHAGIPHVPPPPPTGGSTFGRYNLTQSVSEV